MNLRGIYTVCAVLVPLVTLFAFITFLRVAGVLWAVSAAERPQPTVITEDPVTPAGNPPVTSADAGSGAEPAAEVRAVTGLPEIMNPDAVFYLLVDDFAQLAAAADNESLQALWATPGVSAALQDAAGAIDAGWTAFMNKYEFPVDRVFKGLGRMTGRIEVVISEFTLFRGQYAIKLAAACHPRGDAAVFVDRLRANTAGVMDRRLIRNVEVFEKKGRSGTMSLFIYGSVLYVTAGPAMAETVIDALSAPEREGPSFADNPAFRQAFTDLYQGGGGIVVYAAENIIHELAPAGMPALQGPAGFHAVPGEGGIREYIAVPLSLREYAGRGRRNFSLIAGDDDVLMLTAVFEKALIEELAGLSLRLIGSSTKVTVSADTNGCFWDLLYMLQDHADGAMAGALHLEENSIVPSWYFILRLKDQARTAAWLAQLGTELGTSNRTREDGRTVTIVSLKRSLGTFGSFCYVTDGDFLFCSYSSDVLKKITPETGPPPEEGAHSDLTAAVNAVRFGRFIHEKRLKGLFRSDRFDFSIIEDFGAVGSLIGLLRTDIACGDRGITVRTVSPFGLIPILPAVKILENKCLLMED